MRIICLGSECNVFVVVSVTLGFEEVTMSKCFIHFLGFFIGTANCFEHCLVSSIGFCLERLDGRIEVIEVDSNQLKGFDIRSQFLDASVHEFDFLHGFFFLLWTHSRGVVEIHELGYISLQLCVFRCCTLLIAILITTSFGLTNHRLDLILNGISLFLEHSNLCANCLDFSKDNIDLFTVLLVLRLNSVSLLSS